MGAEHVAPRRGGYSPSERARRQALSFVVFQCADPAGRGCTRIESHRAADVRSPNEPACCGAPMVVVRAEPLAMLRVEDMREGRESPAGEARAAS